MKESEALSNEIESQIQNSKRLYEAWQSSLAVEGELEASRDAAVQRERRLEWIRIDDMLYARRHSNSSGGLYLAITSGVSKTIYISPEEVPKLYRFLKIELGEEVEQEIRIGDGPIRIGDGLTIVPDSVVPGCFSLKYGEAYPDQKHSIFVDRREVEPLRDALTELLARK